MCEKKCNRGAEEDKIYAWNAEQYSEASIVCGKIKHAHKLVKWTTVIFLLNRCLWEKNVCSNDKSQARAPAQSSWNGTENFKVFVLYTFLIILLFLFLLETYEKLQGKQLYLHSRILPHYVFSLQPTKPKKSASKSSQEVQSIYICKSLIF